MTDTKNKLHDYSVIIATINDNLTKGVYSSVTLAGAPLDTAGEWSDLTRKLAEGGLKDVTFFSGKDNKFLDYKGQPLGEAEAKAAQKLVEDYQANSTARINARWEEMRNAMQAGTFNVVYVDGDPIVKKDDWKRVLDALAADQMASIVTYNTRSKSFHDYKGGVLSGVDAQYAQGVRWVHEESVNKGSAFDAAAQLRVVKAQRELLEGLNTGLYNMIAVDGKPVTQTDDWQMVFDAALKNEMVSRVTFFKDGVQVSGHGVDFSAYAEVQAGKPAADKPAADKPAADKPAADKPAADKPAADKPAADKPAADKPAADKPAADKPAAPVRAEPMATGEMTKEKAESYAKALEGILDIGRSQAVQATQNQEGKTEYYILYNLAPASKEDLDAYTKQLQAEVRKAPGAPSLKVGVNAESDILIFPVSAIEEQNKDGKYFERLAAVQKELRAAYDNSGLAEKTEKPKEEAKATPQEPQVPKAGIPLDKLEKLQDAIDKVTKDAPLGIKVADLKPEQLAGADKDKNKQIDGDELSAVIDLLRKSEAGSKATEASEPAVQGGGAKPPAKAGAAK